MTIEDKILIAKFMGADVIQAYSKTDDQDGLIFYYPKDTSPSMYRNLPSNAIKYDTDWNWLMRVVQKMRKEVLFDTTDKCTLRRDLKYNIAYIDIQAACETIVKILKS